VVSAGVQFILDPELEFRLFYGGVGVKSLDCGVLNFLTLESELESHKKIRTLQSLHPCFLLHRLILAATVHVGGGCQFRFPNQCWKPRARDEVWSPEFSNWSRSPTKTITLRNISIFHFLAETNY